jgi:hypothetical protein
MIIGDSFVWGQYVSTDKTLSHNLNELEGDNLFANMGLDGLHPAAMDGLLKYYGKDIKSGIHIDDSRIIDLAPTILNLMNVPIPTDMDGRVLQEIFTTDSCGTIRYSTSSQQKAIIQITRQNVFFRIKKPYRTPCGWRITRNP